MPQLESPPIVLGHEPFSPSSVQQHALGTRAVTRDGRVFRYCQAGAVDLVAGNVIQAAAPLANHLANTPPAVAIGDKSFTYTPGATAGAANLYAEGYLQVDTTPGNGYTYQVSGHPAITASTAFTLTLLEPIQVALTTASRVGLIPNPFKNVIQAPITTLTGMVVGVAPAVITATYYGWLQTFGIASVLVNGTPAIGVAVISPGGAAGAVDVWTAAAQPLAVTVGTMAQTGVSGKNNFVMIRLE